ncbi:Hypothetical protein CINCED_3A010109 [Cinara cedri]|uniref:Uncharacterized protein n=1 Tax=Cinara cedri TaxID=506608 RepID=A0A5E4NSX4_9HEMI|nr:Hypothetical protein CINCED_3A010109 [Cinara cedri]
MRVITQSPLPEISESPEKIPRCDPTIGTREDSRTTTWRGEPVVSIFRRIQPRWGSTDTRPPNENFHTLASHRDKSTTQLMSTTTKRSLPSKKTGNEAVPRISQEPHRPLKNLIPDSPLDRISSRFYMKSVIINVSDCVCCYIILIECC